MNPCPRGQDGSASPGADGILADLHVHVARALGRPVKVAASARLTIPGIIEESLERKGLDVIGLVDAHSPPVLAELDGLVRAGEVVELPGGGLLAGAPVDGSGSRPPGGGGRRRSLVLIPASEVEVVEPGLGPVHYLCYLPDLSTARSFSRHLAPLVHNPVMSSPRARLTGEELACWVGAAGGFVVPAHVFTPHRGFFGQGGRDLRQVLSDRALAAVPAVELGLSADTALADLVGSLSSLTYLTNSDAHSLESIGREHNSFAPPVEPDRSGRPLDFRELAATVRAGRLLANYGLDPRLGKYHRAFCPKCGYSPGGRDVAVGRVCPSCGKAGLVGGVLDRIRALAAARDDAPEVFAGPPRRRPPYVHLVPLRYVPGVGPATRRKLLSTFGTEMDVLHRAGPDELAAAAGPKTASLILAARSGTLSVPIIPGAGGRYGRVRPQ